MSALPAKHTHQTPGLPKHTRFITVRNNVSMNSRKLWNHFALLHRIEAKRAERDGKARKMSHTVNVDWILDKLQMTSRNFAYIEKRLEELTESPFITAKFTKLKGKDDTAFELTKAKWVGSITYSGTLKSGIQDIEFGFVEKVADAIENPEVYGRVDFEEMDLIDTKHGLALYELICDWEFKGKTPEYTIDELQDFFDTDYEFKNFNRYVIKAAVKELNSKNRIIVKPKYIKRGRTVVAISFNIKRMQIQKSLAGSQIEMWSPQTVSPDGPTVSIDHLSEDDLTELKAATLDRLAEEGPVDYFLESPTALKASMLQLYLERQTSGAIVS